MVKCDRCGIDMPTEEAETVEVFGEPWYYCVQCFKRLVAEVRDRGGK